MKKTINIALLFICVLVLVSTLAGCSKESANDTPAEKTAVCFVVGGHANSQGLNMNSPLVQDTIYNTVRNYGFIGVVNADGKPEVIHAASYDIDAKYKCASKDKLDMDARAKATNIVVSMQNVVANDPEVDYLEALRLAVRTLSALEGYDSKKIIALGTGLSTTGVLDFNNNLISAEPDVVVTLLNEKSEIPDFSGITVYWQQLGDVAAPQKDLTSAQRVKLQEIYGGLVEESGGTFIYNEIIANPVNNDTQFPAVTPVSLPDDTPIYFAPEAFEMPEPEDEETVAEENVFEEPVILTEEQVTFIGDKAEYLHPEEAMKTLQPIADYLINHPSITILLAGTTAGDTDSDFSLSLSLSRGKAVMNSLVDLGVDADRIIAVGLGSTKDPWHIWGAGYDGAAASSNRKVVLLDADSDTALEILERQK